MLPNRHEFAGDDLLPERALELIGGVVLGAAAVVPFVVLMAMAAAIMRAPTTWGRVNFIARSGNTRRL